MVWLLVCIALLFIKPVRLFACSVFLMLLTMWLISYYGGSSNAAAGIGLGVFVVYWIEVGYRQHKKRQREIEEQAEAFRKAMIR